MALRQITAGNAEREAAGTRRTVTRLDVVTFSACVVVVMNVALLGGVKRVDLGHCYFLTGARQSTMSDPNRDSIPQSAPPWLRLKLIAVAS